MAMCEAIKTVAVLGIGLPVCLLLSACVTPAGPAYDSAQDNPKNALPESIVLFKQPTEGTASSGQSGADKGAGEYQEFLQYQQWRQAKESNSLDYQEFLEFRQWLLVNKQRQSAEGS